MSTASKVWKIKEMDQSTNSFVTIEVMPITHGSKILVELSIFMTDSSAMVIYSFKYS